MIYPSENHFNSQKNIRFNTILEKRSSLILLCVLRVVEVAV